MKKANALKKKAGSRDSDRSRESRVSCHPQQGTLQFLSTPASEQGLACPLPLNIRPSIFTFLDVRPCGT